MSQKWIIEELPLLKNPLNDCVEVMYAAANLAEEIQYDAQDYGLDAKLGKGDIQK